MRLVWLTDLHLNVAGAMEPSIFATVSPIETLYREIRRKAPDALVVTGDTAHWPEVPSYLQALGEIAPTYFVLGNHDFYGSSIQEVRTWAQTRQKPPLCWLEAAEVIPLTEKTALVGVDGFGDAQTGNVTGSPMVLNDWFYIEELANYHLGVLTPAGRRARNEVLRRLGEEAAAALQKPLTEALERFSKVIIATHVPPWPEAAWHEGRTSNADAQPWYVCVAVGKLISKLAERYPHREILVLTGHTHGKGRAEIHSNVTCLTGGARYRYPGVQMVFDIQ